MWNLKPASALELSIVTAASSAPALVTIVLFTSSSMPGVVALRTRQRRWCSVGGTMGCRGEGRSSRGDSGILRAKRDALSFAPVWLSIAHALTAWRRASWTGRQNASIPALRPGSRSVLQSFQSSVAGHRQRRANGREERLAVDGLGRNLVLVARRLRIGVRGLCRGGRCG